LVALKRLFPGINRDSLLDAVRTALAAVVAMLLGRLLGMPEYYWAPISTIVIMQSTLPVMTHGWQRFLGTALGAILGIAFASLTHPVTTLSFAALYALGVFLCGVVTFLVGVGGAFRFAAITLSIIFLISRRAAPWIAGWHRFLEVSLGIAVAVVFSRLWPLDKKTT
jgi:uncharacterized membrane protein YgaE (UPF0421/DUF939 family)